MIHAVMDIIGILGIIMLGYGLWLIAPMYMFLIMGGLLLVFALLSEHGTVTIRNSYKKKN